MDRGKGEAPTAGIIGSGDGLVASGAVRGAAPRWWQQSAQRCGGRARGARAGGRQGVEDSCPDAGSRGRRPGHSGGQRRGRAGWGHKEAPVAQSWPPDRSAGTRLCPRPQLGPWLLAPPFPASDDFLLQLRVPREGRWA